MQRVFIFLFILFSLPLKSQDSIKNFESGILLAQKNFKHAQTWFWYGREKSNSLFEFEKARDYLRKSRLAIDNIATGTIIDTTFDPLLTELEHLEVSLNAIDEIVSDNINGRYPLYMSLMGLNDEYEFFDIPMELAMENSLKKVLKIPLGNRALYEHMYYSVAVLNVDDPGLEEIAHEYISNYSDHYIISRYELSGILDSSSLKNIYDGNLTTEMVSDICFHFGIEELGVFKINFEDQVDNLVFWTSDFSLVNSNSDEKSMHLFAPGFINDKRSLSAHIVGYIAIALVALIIILTLVTLKNAKYTSGNTKQSNNSIELILNSNFTFISSLLSAFLIIKIIFHLIRIIAPAPEEYFGTAKVIFFFNFLFPFILIIIPVFVNYIIGLRIKGEQLLRTPNLFGLVSGSLLAWVFLFSGSSYILYGDLKQTAPFLIAAILILLSSFYVANFFRELKMQSKRVYIIAILFITGGVLLIPLFAFVEQGILLKSWPILLLIPALILTGISYPNLNFKWRKVDIVNALIYNSEKIDSQEKLKSFFDNPIISVPYCKDEENEVLFQDLLKRISQGPEYQNIDIFFLEGPRGIGKTRMIKEFKTFLENAGNFAVFYGDCDEFPDSNVIPYEPFYEALHHYLGVGRFQDHSQDAHSAAGFLETLDIGPISALAGFMGLGAEKNAGPDINEVVIDIKKLFSKRIQKDQDLLLIIEDIQWMDDSTLRMFISLLKAIAPESKTFSQLKIILTARIDSDSEDRSQGRTNTVLKEIRSINNNNIAIKNFKEDLQIKIAYDNNYLDKLIKNNNISMNYYSLRKLKEYFIDQKYTSPIHINQVMVNIVEKGWLTYENEEFKLKKEVKLENLLPPEELSLIYRERFTRLDQDMLKILISAAYIGRSFDAKILASVWWGVDNAEDKLLELFHNLQKAELLGLIADKTDEDDVYEFTSRALMAELRSYSTTILTEGQGSDGIKGYTIRHIPQVVREYQKRIIKAIEQIQKDMIGIDLNLICSLAVRCQYLDEKKETNALKIVKYNATAGIRCTEAGRLEDANEFFKTALHQIMKIEQSTSALTSEIVYSPAKITLHMLQNLLDMSKENEALSFFNDSLFKDTPHYPEYLVLKAIINFGLKSQKDEIIKILDEFDHLDQDSIAIEIKERAVFCRTLTYMLDPKKDPEEWLKRNVNQINRLRTNLTNLKLKKLFAEILNNTGTTLIWKDGPQGITLCDEVLCLLLNIKAEKFPLDKRIRIKIIEDDSNFDILSTHSKNSLKRTLRSLGSYYNEIKKFSESLVCLSRALRLNEILGDKFGEAMVKKDIGETMSQSGQNKWAEVFATYVEAYWIGKFSPKLDDRFYGPLINGLKKSNEKGNLELDEEIKRIEADRELMNRST